MNNIKAKVFGNRRKTSKSGQGQKKHRLALSLGIARTKIRAELFIAMYLK